MYAFYTYFEEEKFMINIPYQLIQLNDALPRNWCLSGRFQKEVFVLDQKHASSSWIIDLARAPPERRHHHTPKSDVIDELCTQNEGTKAAHETPASYAIATMGL